MQLQYFPADINKLNKTCFVLLPTKVKQPQTKQLQKSFPRKTTKRNNSHKTTLKTNTEMEKQKNRKKTKNLSYRKQKTAIALAELPRLEEE